jgi:hypothetical protein
MPLPSQLRGRLGKPKRMHPRPNPSALTSAAAAAVYSPSDYHCRGRKGQPLKSRGKPASACPKRWSDTEATRVLRKAIADGNVSEAWEDGFPRYVWHRDGEITYEARHTRGPTGTFHAYPIEAIQTPDGFLS